MLGAIAVDNLSRSSRWQVLGNHCYEHVAMVLERPWSYGSEIARTDALIRAQIGRAHV